MSKNRLPEASSIDPARLLMQGALSRIAWRSDSSVVFVGHIYINCRISRGKDSYSTHLTLLNDLFTERRRRKKQTNAFHLSIFVYGFQAARWPFLHSKSLAESHYLLPPFFESCSNIQIWQPPIDTSSFTPADRYPIAPTTFLREPRETILLLLKQRTRIFFFPRESQCARNSQRARVAFRPVPMAHRAIRIRTRRRSDGTKVTTEWIRGARGIFS